MFFGGRFSHAVRKRPREGEFRIQSEHGGRREAASAPASCLRAAQRVLERVGRALAMARIDMVDDAGEWALMEAELIDPELYLGFDQASPARFAAALADALGG